MQKVIKENLDQYKFEIVTYMGKLYRVKSIDSSHAVLEDENGGKTTMSTERFKKEIYVGRIVGD